MTLSPVSTFQLGAFNSVPVGWSSAVTATSTLPQDNFVIASEAKQSPVTLEIASGFRPRNDTQDAIPSWLSGAISMIGIAQMAPPMRLPNINTNIYESLEVTPLMWLVAGALLVISLLGFSRAREKNGSIEIDGNKAPGKFPAKNFSKAVIDKDGRSLRIFETLEELRNALGLASIKYGEPISIGDDSTVTFTAPSSFTTKASVTKKIGKGAEYSALYYFNDGELRFMRAQGPGNWENGQSKPFDYTPPPIVLQPISNSAYTGEPETRTVGWYVPGSDIAAKIYKSAGNRGGAEFKIPVTIADFRKMFGYPVQKDEDECGLSWRKFSWRGDPTNTSPARIVLEEYSTPTKFSTFLLRGGITGNIIGEVNDKAYSRAVIETIYNEDGSPIETYLHEGRKYTSYQLVLIFGRDGGLKRYFVLVSEFEIGGGTTKQTVALSQKLTG